MKNHSGHTPMADITYKYEDRIGHVYAKLEYYNPSGSIKDRIASYILGKAEETGQLRPGQPIIETTSGNTGIAIAAYGALAKHPVHIFMPDWVSIERVKLMKMYGANVHLISKEENGFLGALDQTEKLAKELGGFILGQFSNKDNMMAHYNYTAAEILQTLPDIKFFVSGVCSVYIARKLGLDVVAYEAPVVTRFSNKTLLLWDVRETLARVKSFFLVAFRAKPTYLGEQIPITGDAKLSWD